MPGSPQWTGPRALSRQQRKWTLSIPNGERFASQIKSILSIQNLRFNNSDAGICSYFMFGNVIDPFTIYKEIKSLEKGNVLVINKDGVKKKINFY